MQNQSPHSMMLGVGLDNQDGQKRITKGENFVLVGGSEETHERMTETAIRVNEKLSARGKTLDTVGRDEFIDIISECSE